jgi:hypothetical protein
MKAVIIRLNEGDIKKVLGLPEEASIRNIQASEAYQGWTMHVEGVGYETAPGAAMKTERFEGREHHCVRPWWPFLS